MVGRRKHRLVYLGPSTIGGPRPTTCIQKQGSMETLWARSGVRLRNGYVPSVGNFVFVLSRAYVVF